LVFLAHAEVARPSVWGVLGGWSTDPLVWASLIAAAGLYAWGLGRVRGYPRERAVHFFIGIALLAVTLAGPVALYDDSVFWVHMLQHLLITAVAAPLLALGAPMALALRALPANPRRRLSRVLSSAPVRALTHPVLTWLYLGAWLWIVHFTPLYEAALVNDNVHALEHVGFLFFAYLWWWPIVGLDPGARRIAWPVRLVYLIAFMPVGVVLGLAIYSAAAPLYPHYADLGLAWAPGPLADQRLAGEIMWEVGMLLNFAALPFLIFGWLRHERRQTETIDRRLDREAAAAKPS
jgi:putative membrane protein